VSLERIVAAARRAGIELRTGAEQLRAAIDHLV
jgi:hypothetical protein